MNFNCTILIPTQNRKHLLTRAIKYYEDVKFKFCNIIILDSSTKFTKYKINKNFLHINCKKFSFCSKILYGIKKAKTKFVIICNDDDFIACNGLKKGINFLNINKKHSAYQGEFIFFRKLEKLNLLTFNCAYEDTLKYNLNFNQINTEKRIKSLYLSRPHWYNALHYKKYLIKAFEIASKGNDLHFCEYVLPLVIGGYGYLKTDKIFWYAKDANVYKDLSIVSKKNQIKNLNEILNLKSKVKVSMIDFIKKKIKKNDKYCNFFLNNLFKFYFQKYLLNNKENNIKINFHYIRKFLPLTLKNILHIIYNLIKNKNFINSSNKKKYGPTRNKETYNDWLFMKKNIMMFDKNFTEIYKNLK